MNFDLSDQLCNPPDLLPSLALAPHLHDDPLPIFSPLPAVDSPASPRPPSRKRPPPDADSEEDEEEWEGQGEGDGDVVDILPSLPCPSPFADEATDLPAAPIDERLVWQMGGLSYAELCKERAREQIKEKKRNEYLNSGNSIRIKRLKKNDTTMSEGIRRQRRLQMNQDSAFAARKAMVVYVHTLERLVDLSERERQSCVDGLNQVRLQRDVLQKKVRHLECLVQQVRQEHSQNSQHSISSSPSSANTLPHSDTHHLLLDLPDHPDKPSSSSDPFVPAKLLDLLRVPPSIGVVLPDEGVRPTRAM